MEDLEVIDTLFDNTIPYGLLLKEAADLLRKMIMKWPYLVQMYSNSGEWVNKKSSICISFRDMQVGRRPNKKKHFNSCFCNASESAILVGILLEKDKYDHPADMVVTERG